MPSRLLYKEKAIALNMAVLPITAAAPVSLRASLAAQPRPGHPWSVSGMSVTLLLRTNSNPDQLNVDLFLWLAGQQYVLFHTVLDGVFGGLFYEFTFAEQQVNANFGLDWTDTCSIEFKFSDPTASGINNVVGDQECTLGFFGSIQ